MNIIHAVCREGPQQDREFFGTLFERRKVLMALDTLFSQIKINSMELKNRAVMPAIGTGYGNTDSTVSDRLVAYLARRARGGTGLIITEICAVDPRGRGFKAEVGIWDDSFLPGLSRIPEAVHREGGKVAAQLHHAGRETFQQVLDALPEAPSAIPSVILNQPCEEMSIERILEVVNAYGSAALRAKQAGFDAVEIHGAHGYLITQFLSPFSNQRTDEYGGTDENRARFAIEIVEAVRRSVGPDYPILMRVSADELIRGGYDLEFMKYLAPRLEAAGVDALHVSVGVYSTPGNLSIPSMDTEEGFNLFRARAIKGLVSIPVIGVGRIHDPRLAEEALQRGDADLISFGRQHLTDPDFLLKAKRGDYDDIRWCMACNQGCIERLSYEMKSATCSLNPECGQEYRGDPKQELSPKRVWVIGAGPAGLSAALAAKKRGHDVEIYEREQEAGGQLISASKPPHKEGLGVWYRWALRQAEKAGIPVKCGITVTPELLGKEKPDAVVLAAGALPVVPPIPGIDGAHVYDARDVLLEKVNFAGPVVVLGGGYVGMETMDFLLGKGIAATLLEMQDFPPVGKHTAHGYWLHRRIRKGGGTIVTGAKVTDIKDNAVTFIKNGEVNELSPVNMVVTALGVRPENDLGEALKSREIPFLTAGDVISPRRIIEAIHEGHRAGLEI